jgi:hypothetical protein
MELDRLRVNRKTGAEPLQRNGLSLGHTLLDFWQWSASDVVSNATRGRLAEFIVATALGIDTGGVRNEWAAFDLITPDGVKIEVKSSGFIQTWYQRALSSINFSTKPTREWDSTTNLQSREVRRQADVYVFALHRHADKSTIDPLEVTQWSFYVLPTSELNARPRSQSSITLNSLKKMCGAISQCATTARRLDEPGETVTVTDATLVPPGPTATNVYTVVDAGATATSPLAV